VVSGICADKVSTYEGWRHKNYDPGAAASAAIDRLSQLEGKVKLEVTVERTRPVEAPKAAAIDCPGLSGNSPG
jgi:hypothetical protein